MATFQYIGTGGRTLSFDAPDAATALKSAPGIAPGSGVMAVSPGSRNLNVMAGNTAGTLQQGQTQSSTIGNTANSANGDYSNFNTAISQLLQKYQGMQSSPNGGNPFVGAAATNDVASANASTNAMTDPNLKGYAPSTIMSAGNSASAPYNPVASTLSNETNIFNSGSQRFLDAAKSLLADNETQQQQAQTRAAGIIHDAIAGGSDALKAFLADPNSAQVMKLAGYSADTLQGTATGLKKAEDTKAASDAADLANKRASTAKIYSDMGTASTDSVNSWATNIKSGVAKLTEVPANLRNAVSIALTQGGSSPSTIMATTKASLQELNDMVNNNHGFTSAVGTNIPNPLGLFTDPADQIGFKGLAGSQSSDFIAKLNQVKNDVVLPNLNLLKGLGRITDREFQALSSSLTSLNTNLTEGQFKTELKDVTDRINAVDTGTSGTTDTGARVTPSGIKYTITQ